MSTTALHPTSAATSLRVPALARVAAALALPLGLMNCVGVVIFWEWSPDAWVGVLGGLIGLATLAGAVGTLLRRPAAAVLLRRAMVGQLAFTVIKLVGWQEGAALVFGAVALTLLALLLRAGD
jgi:hypothetical protein